jgi:alkylation response protein AidB-like acyl-CoA dehydrogenase
MTPLAGALALAPRVRAEADRIERERRLTPELVQAMAAAGVFRLLVPRALGGLEVEPTTFVTTVEALAEADGSAGWCAMIAATSAVIAAYLAEDVAREIYGRPDVVTGGAFAPQGTATVVQGGYRVRGRWAFGSGCESCHWLMGGTVVTDGGRTRALPSGAPDPRLMLFPAGEARVIDTWTVSGLRGTGSHDFTVEDVFVPAGRSISLVTDRPRASGALYAFPVFGLLATGIASVALGIGRRALDEVTTLAGAKTPALGRRLLRERPMIQVRVAEAEAALGSARAFLLETIDAAWTAAGREGAIPLALRARLRLAATASALGAARAVDAAYEAGGASSIYATSALQRCFRDVHALTQHMLVAPATLELVGRVLLGVETDVGML